MSEVEEWDDTADWDEDPCSCQFIPARIVCHYCRFGRVQEAELPQDAIDASFAALTAPTRSESPRGNETRND